MKDSKVEEQYSFHPELVTQHDGNRRNLEQFIADQDKFRQSVAEKVKSKQEQESTETVSLTNPHVLRASTRMVGAMEDRKGVDTKERLYNLNKQWLNKKAQKLNEEAEQRKKTSEQSFN